MINFLIAAVATFIGLFLIGPSLSGICRALGLYTVVQER
jgi:formate hydrogenlyase subunit 4